MPRFDTLHAVLAANARDDREITLIHGSDERTVLGFAQLRERALGLLGVLQRRGLQPGDAMLLCVPDNAQFLVMFWACVLGGIVPVPLAAGGGDEHRRKLFRVLAQFDRASVCIDAAGLDKQESFAAAEGLAEEMQRLRGSALVAGELEASADGAPGVPWAAGPDDAAFIQFSSGSTGEPKGVVLTHRNLTANLDAIVQASAFTDRDVALSWMPLSHDMGLIGFHLSMLSAGIGHAIMRTDLFARRPLFWLELASQMQATVLCSPNFGYQHYLRQSERKPPTGLDLSAVRLVFNGAEPISAELCRRFMQALAPHGLQPDSMFPVYGLAEASLGVTFPRIGAPMQTVHLDRTAFRVGAPVREVPAADRSAVEFVLLGTAIPHVEVRIVDDAGTALAEPALGHVEIRGDNVTRGYHRRGQPLVGAAPSGGNAWLDTGDLGVIWQGQLVITGRAKDLVIVNGQNYYPHDLERLAQRVAGIEANLVVAAGVRRGPDDTEALALFVQHRGLPADLAPTVMALRRLMGQETGLELGVVVPVQQIPKTTSGKVQRYALVQAFELGEFDAALAAMAPALAALTASEAGAPEASEGVAEAAAGGALDAPAILQRLLVICREVVPERPLSADSNLLEINLNSLTLARIHEGIDREFPDQLEVTDLFEYPTLEGLAAFLAAKA